MTPISLLPDDIVCAIFEDLSIGDGVANEVYWDWIAVTFVCKHWKRVALEASILWASIVSTKATSITRTRLFLQRSRNASLTVRLMDKDFDSIKLCLGHMHRIRSLNIEGKFGLMKWLCIQTLLGGYAPRLRSVELVNLSHEEHTASLQLGSWVEKTTNSSLKSLRLLGFSVAWIPSLDGLTELSICNIANSIKCPSFSQLIAILGSCPALVKFRMRNVCINESDADAAPIVELPSLKELYICDVNPSAVFKLMLHLILPGDVCCKLELESESLYRDPTLVA